MRRLRKLGKAARAVAIAAAVSVVGTAGAGLALAHDPEVETTTPIEHVVVIFQENVSFDHYFRTYPFAANTDGCTPFQSANSALHFRETPRIRHATFMFLAPHSRAAFDAERGLTN